MAALKRGLPEPTHSFEGRIVHHNLGTYQYTVVFLPGRLADEFEWTPKNRVRMRGKFGGVPFAAAWQPSRGRWYFMISKPLLRRSGYSVGELAWVSFQTESPDKVDTPEILTEALKKAKLNKHWAALTPGLRRGYAYRVASARRPETVERRLAEVLELVKEMAEEREPALSSLRL